MGTPLGSVVWVPAAAVELGTLSHLPCWLPVLRRGGRPDSPPTWGTAQAAGAPRRAAPGLQGTWVSGIQASLLPRAVWAVPAWNGEGGVRSKPPSLAASLFSAFIRRRGWGRGGGALCSQPHTVSHPWQARLSSPPSPTGAAFLHGALGEAGGTEEGVPPPPQLCPARPVPRRCHGHGAGPPGNQPTIDRWMLC